MFNFTPVARKEYQLGSRHPGWWREIFNSDAACYGGSGAGNAGGVQAQSPGLGLWPHRVSLTLPPLGAVFFKAEEHS